MKHFFPKIGRRLVPLSYEQSVYFFLQIFLVSWIAIAWIAGNAFAQSNFTPMSTEDVEEREDTLMFSAGLKISADYRLHVRHMDSSTFPPYGENEINPKGLSFEHELRIGLRSIFHRNLSINAELEIRQGAWQEADLREENSLRKVPDSQSAQVQARQAFLEFNSNPRNILRAGKHAFNIGDRRGKVFSGILTGISQDCTIGTWCYQLGAAKIGRHSAEWLYYGSLNYPVFHDKNEDGATSRLLDIEIFRILYTERDVPLGRGNGPVFRETTTMQATTGDKGWYYDAREQEYFGILVNWELFPLNLRFDLTGNQGKRRYHLKDSSERSKQSIAGVASELELSYQLDNHQIGFRGLMASGDEEINDPDNSGANFLRTLNGYHEIVPGTYKGTNFYFNGGGLGLTSGTGLGHSVSNTNMFGGWYQLTLEEYSFMYRGGLFQLARSKPTLNAIGKQVSNIGLEWDNTLFWKWDKHLHTELEINFFMAGEAFNYNDNHTPLERNEPITHLVARIFYSF